MIAPRTPLRTVALVAGLLLALAPAGCSTGKRLYPVEGTVVYEDGAPATDLARGTVSFESVEDRSNAAGEIRPDGTFRIRTPPGQDGAAAGAYRVVVLPPEGADRNRPPIDRRYGRYETSGIEIMVEARENRIAIPVKRPHRGAAR
jgi:hypothetical protein